MREYASHCIIIQDYAALSIVPGGKTCNKLPWGRADKIRLRRQQITKTISATAIQSLARSLQFADKRDDGGFDEAFVVVFFSGFDFRPPVPGAVCENCGARGDRHQSRQSSGRAHWQLSGRPDDL